MYTSDRHQFEHYLHVTIDKLSENNLVLDNRRLNTTTIDWSVVCNSSNQGLGLVSMLLLVNQGFHRLYTVDGRPLSGYVYGFSNISAYGSTLASVTDAIGQNYRLWPPPPRDTHVHSQTTSVVVETTLSSHVIDGMTSSVTSESTLMNGM